jgi:hypothetical protein
VSSKLKEGDFRGAVRLASSDESFAPYDETTLKKLRDKHPPAHSESIYPLPQDTQEVLQVTPSIVKKSIFSFLSGSAAGPDGLHPQHLKLQRSHYLSCK